MSKYTKIIKTNHNAADFTYDIFSQSCIMYIL